LIHRFTQIAQIF